MSKKKQILIISHDKIGTSMAGPGIRYHYMAEVLSSDFDVTIGFFDSSYLPDNEFKKSYRTIHIDSHKFEDAFINQDVIIALWLSDAMLEYCNKHSVFLVFDVYAPVPVENLALFLYNGEPVTQETDFTYKQSFAMYDKFFANGDLFLFSNRRQLDYWIGYVFGSDQIRVSSYIKRPVFDRFIYAPMGIDTSQPLKVSKPVIRDVIQGITATDKILLWTGGIWNWFDAQTLVRAMDMLKDSHPEIKLVFFGTKHPNPNVPAMQEATDTHNLAKELGLLNKTIFMKEGWVDYADRINYLLEADAAVNTTKQTIESEFSHRTRVLDHFLTELPTISTEGDYLSDEVINRQELGFTVAANNAKELSQAIIDVLQKETNETMRQNIAAMRDNYDWEKVLHDLLKTLRGDLQKLERVTIKPTKQLPDSNSARLVKRILPVFIKKLIIRVFRYGN